MARPLPSVGICLQLPGETGTMTACSTTPMSTMKAEADLTLFGTLACHLCDEAKHILAPLLGNGLRLAEQDITEDATLMQRYALRIPVLRREDTGAELDFPFDLPQVMDWLGDVLGEEG